MRVNELLLEAISLQGLQFTNSPKVMAQYLGDFEDKHFFADLEEEVEKIFPKEEGYEYGDNDKLYIKGPSTGYVNEKTGEAVIIKTVSIYRNVDTGVGNHYGYQRFMLQLMLLILVRKGVVRQVDVIANQYEKSSGASLRGKPAKKIFEASKTTAKVASIVPMIKAAKKEFIKDIDELHKKMEAIRSQALNAIHKVQPEKEFPEGKQTQAFLKFGADLKKLVDKYAEFNVDDTSVDAGYYGSARLTAGKSGKIEFVDEYTHHGDYYQGSHSGRFAVKIGSNYPADKAEAFAVEYMKLVKKQLPVEMPVRYKDGVKQAKLSVFTATGTNYTTLMIRF
jgi:hypothetical protein